MSGGVAAAGTAFEVAGRAWTWADVVAWARETGRFAAVEHETSEGAACLGAVAHAAGLDERKVRAAAAEHRRARLLLSAEETEAWLARWGLSVRDWMDYVRRTVAREHCHGEGRPATGELALPGGEGRVWATAVCSGALERLAADLAARLAAQAALAERGCECADPEVAYEHLRRHAVTPRALAHRVDIRRLEWMRVDYEILGLPTLDSAREALLCLRDDGVAPAELAQQAQLEHRRESRLLREVDDGLRTLLLGTAIGSVGGPVERQGGFILVVPASREPPVLEDDRVRALAEEEVAAAAVRREVHDRVRWLGSP